MVSDATLGQGTYAKVRLSSHIRTQELYAMKIIKKPELEVKEKNIIKSATKEVTGEVSAISKDFIAIVYSWDKEKGAVPFFPFSAGRECGGGQTECLI